MTYSATKPFPEVERRLDEGDILGALDLLLQQLSGWDPVYLQQFTERREAHLRLVKDHQKGLVANDVYFKAVTHLNRDIRYLLRQIPAKTEQAPVPAAPKSNVNGKLLHDIPSFMPQQMETRCTIRLAYDEDTLLEHFEISKDTKIEDIRVAEIMEVELLDYNQEKAFQIRSFNATEQTVDSGQYTEWMFFVRPIRRGHFTLFLKISVIQYLHGKERKKDIVLEKDVTVSTLMEAEEPAISRRWQDAHVIIGAQSDRNAPPLIIPARQEKSSKAGVLAGSLAVTALLAAALFYFFRKTPQVAPAPENLVPPPVMESLPTPSTEPEVSQLQPNDPPKQAPEVVKPEPAVPEPPKTIMEPEPGYALENSLSSGPKENASDPDKVEFQLNGFDDLDFQFYLNGKKANPNANAAGDLYLEFPSGSNAVRVRILHKKAHIDLERSLIRGKNYRWTFIREKISD